MRLHASALLTVRLLLQVNKVCLSVKKAAGRKQKADAKGKGGKGALHEGDELAYDEFEEGGGDYDD